MIELSPYVEALTGIVMNRNPIKLRAYWEPKKYYEVRALIIAECYLRGHNPKEIAHYFKIGVFQIYRYCSIKNLKAVKAKRAYKELILRDLILKDNGQPT